MQALFRVTKHGRNHRELAEQGLSHVVGCNFVSRLPDPNDERSPLRKRLCVRQACQKSTGAGLRAPIRGLQQELWPGMQNRIGVEPEAWMEVRT